MAKKSAIMGEYIITQEDNDSIRVCRIFDNVIASLREAAKAVKFKSDPKWNTRQFGKKMVDEFGDGSVAEVDEYTIMVRGDGAVDTYRVYGNTIKALREIAAATGFTPDEKWNTRQFGSRLIDFGNGKEAPAKEEPEVQGLKISPEMTVSELQEAFREMFGGHLRIKNGTKRCDAYHNVSDGKDYPVLEATLAEIGCKEEGVFSPDLTVEEFQTGAKEKCGISLVVATCDDWVATLPGFTLDGVNLIPRNTTKAKMQEMLDR